jgi:hypothetical protein
MGTVNDRLCRIRIRGKFSNLTIILAYAPTEDKGEEGKVEFYSKLERICSRVPKYEMLIIMGDFNTNAGREECRHKVSGKHSLHEHSSENGLFLVQFAIRNNFYIKSTTFPHKTIHMGMWKIPGFTEVNQIDHVLVSARHVSSIIDVRNSRGAECDSDHYLVKAKVRERISRGWKHRAGHGRRKWNSDLITSPEGKTRHQASLEKKLEGTKIIESESLDMNKMWNGVKETIIAAGEEVMGTTTIQKRNVEWFDEKCREKTAKKNEARRRMLQKETWGSCEKYKELQKEVKK